MTDEKIYFSAKEKAELEFLHKKSLVKSKEFEKEILNFINKENFNEVKTLKLLKEFYELKTNFAEKFNKLLTEKFLSFLDKNGIKFLINIFDSFEVGEDGVVDFFEMNLMMYTSAVKKKFLEEVYESENENLHVH